MNEKVKISWHITRDFPKTPNTTIPDEWSYINVLTKVLRSPF